MVNISGSNIAATIVPFTTEDTYATHESRFGKGGWHEIKTYNEINSIPRTRQTEGMAVYVLDTDELYILKNSNWNLYKPKLETHIFDQAVSSNIWKINHNLGRYPSVTVVDSAGTEVIGDVQYIDTNNIIIEFTSEFSGKAYLN